MNENITIPKNARQFRKLPLPEIAESNESGLCKEAIEYISNENNNELKKIINNPSFDVNERFDTSYTQRDNLIDYSIFWRNIRAAYILLETKKVELDDCDLQDILDKLTLSRRYITLYKTLRLIDPDFKIVNFINGCITVDVDKIYKKSKHQI
jgi:hypothetical protein